MQKVSRQNYSIKMFTALDGLHIMHHRNVAYKLHQVAMLFFHYYKVTTFNMQAHLMQLNMKYTAVLNPGQTPADVSDQHVYALTKDFQFRHPEMFSQYFPIFGQLYIEQSLLVIHGQLIKDSGLVQILTENKFSIIGLSAVIDVNSIES